MAQRLAELTGLPLIHLDQIFWKPRWVEPSKDEWLVCLEEALARPAWIMDGNYNRTLEVRLRLADTVILLDLPRRTCLWNVVKRIFSTFGRVRPDMAPDCPERFNLEFLRYVWNYHRTRQPNDLRLLQSFSGTQIVLRSRREVREYLARFEVSRSLMKA
jgi:adenylate kinase family enzyme